MGRLGGRAVVCGICLWLVLDISPAGAARSASLATAQVAARFARIIRQDTRQEGHRAKTAVTVTKRCCGVWVLRVHYRAETTRSGRHDTYVLRLETKHGELQGVAVSEASTEVGYRSRHKVREDTWQYEFAVYRKRGGVNGGWSFGLSYGGTSWTAGPVGEPQMGLGFSRECVLPAPVPVALYEQALKVLASARRRAPMPEVTAAWSCQ
jgi:hypothetical protein